MVEVIEPAGAGLCFAGGCSRRLYLPLRCRLAECCAECCLKAMPSQHHPPSKTEIRLNLKVEAAC